MTTEKVLWQLNNPIVRIIKIQHPRLLASHSASPYKRQYEQEVSQLIHVGRSKLTDPIRRSQQAFRRFQQRIDGKDGHSRAKGCNV